MDGFTALPVSTIGNEYIVASYRPWTESQISIAAIEDNTEVTITLSNSWRHTNINLNRGEKLRFNLKKYQTVHLNGKTDPTGSRIESNKPISVLTGCRCAFVPGDITSCDHLVEQLPPFNKLGRSFIASAFMGRASSTVFRLIAARPNTRVDFSDGRNRTLSAGGFMEFETTLMESLYIHASMPCLLVAYAKGFESDSKGDPTMTIVPPLDQGVHSARFITYNVTRDGDVVRSFITILGECFALENATIGNEKITTLMGRVLYHQIGSSRYCIARLPVDNGIHTISCHHHYFPFVAYAYGFADFNSYSFPIGMAANTLTCNTRGVEHFCVERVVAIPPDELMRETLEQPQCDYSECVNPIHVILIAAATGAGAIIIEYYMRRKFSERRKEREKKRRRSMMRSAAAAISSLSFNRDRRPALTGNVNEES
ncbi:uncharacterized protein LOC121409611 [Lytechinus variegatus]|uniref:uncharacterized protein LOC121409611 n=1 Tax=Lytechinus variegatus TaxID=7654 RepID=UPI001BB27EAD|nr:uncharacterized protein LOC121409611 [Lytechinus variegatus]